MSLAQTNTSPHTGSPVPGVVAVVNPHAAKPANPDTFWESLVSAFPLPAFVKDSSQTLVAVSQTFCELFDTSFSKLAGFQNIELEFGVGLLDRELERHVLQTCEPVCYERTYRCKQKSGVKRKTVRVRQSFVLDTEGQPFLLGTVEDLSDVQHRLESAERQTELAAAFDPLTGLANRSQLETQLTRALQETSRQADVEAFPLSVLFIDLNNFKSVNNSGGHSTGDEVIRVCANRIRDAVNRLSVVARVGGDEFVILLPNAGSTDAGVIADEIRQLIQCPIEAHGSRREVSCSVGISVFPRDGRTASELLRKADHAMLEAKTFKPDGRVEFYKPAIGVSVERRLMLERDLLDAVSNDKIELHFQPIVRRENQQDAVIGYEALSRWIRDGGENVRPDEFIPVLENSGQIVLAGENILRRACKFIAGSGTSAGYVSVNISGRQLADPGFLAMVDRVIAATGVSHQRLAFELTETAAMADDPNELRLLNELVDRGIRLMIDDFGTGYSNLSRLRRLPFHVLKIDRGLIRDVPESRSDSAIVETLIRMASEMQMELIVEGVEQNEQRDYLVKLGVNTFQGYLFGKPKPMKSIA